MGKPSRGTTRKSRKPSVGAIDIDKPIVDETGSAGNAEALADDSVASDGSIVNPARVGTGSGNPDNNGSGDHSTGNIDPVTGKRKYKRRGATKTADAVSLDIGSFKDILFSTHAMLAALTSSPALELDEEEAAKLAKGISNVTRHYNVPQMAQKSVDWIMLMQTCGAVYGPRVMAWKLDRQMRNAKPAPQHKAAPQNISPAPTAPNQPPREAPRAAPKMETASPVGMRSQPGLGDLDGANLPLKLVN